MIQAALQVRSQIRSENSEYLSSSIWLKIRVTLVWRRVCWGSVPRSGWLQ